MCPPQEQNFYTTSLLRRARFLVTEDVFLVVEERFLVTEDKVCFFCLSPCAGCKTRQGDDVAV